MVSNYYPMVQHLAIPNGTFFSYPKGWTLPQMQTVYETRRQRLEMLIKKPGAIADLNEALGWSRTDPRISRIRNANVRTDRDGKVFQMGDAMARGIEAALHLAEGWMDTPPSLAEQFGHSEAFDKMAELMAAMEPAMQYQAVRVVVRWLNQQKAPTATKTNLAPLQARHGEAANAPIFGKNLEGP